MLHQAALVTCAPAHAFACVISNLINCFLGLVVFACLQISAPWAVSITSAFYIDGIGTVGKPVWLEGCVSRPCCLVTSLRFSRAGTSRLMLCACCTLHIVKRMLSRCHVYACLANVCSADLHVMHRVQGNTGCTMKEAGKGSFACFTCFACVFSRSCFQQSLDVWPVVLLPVPH
jgi:hypothetical protein